MDIYQIAGSLVSIILLALLAQKLFKDPVLDHSRVTNYLADMMPPLVADSVIISDTGRSAIVTVTSSPSSILLRMMGDKISSHSLAPDGIQVKGNKTVKFSLSDYNFSDFSDRFDIDNKLLLQLVNSNTSDVAGDK